MAEDHISRTASCVNRAALKRYILELTRTIKPHWQCTRVAGEVFDRYEGVVTGLIVHVSLELEPRISLPAFEKDRITNWSVVRRRLLDYWRGKLKWLVITKVDEVALRHIEDRLRAKIHSDIAAHPTLGHTFKV